MCILQFNQVFAWTNLISAWRKASRGKRSKATVADFEYQLADNLLDLQQSLQEESYKPGAYTHFTIHEPKQRLISAAPFRDRVVHHALCNVIEPSFERRFIPDSYANRLGKGTHKALDRVQQFAHQYPYVLRLDIVKHFPSLDHQLLLDNLANIIQNNQIFALVKTIIASGQGVHEQNCQPQLFPGDDLLALCRPRGLPIGNLTSQFWSNCYLHPLDLFVKRELGCRGYLRYVDDFCLFAQHKSELWEWKQAVQEKLAKLRLNIHEKSAQVIPTRCGIPWLGFVVYPDYRRVKSRKVVEASRRLTERFDAWQADQISFAEFDASVQGWINHVRHADSWGLRNHVLNKYTW